MNEFDHNYPNPDGSAPQPEAPQPEPVQPDAPQPDAPWYQQPVFNAAPELQAEPIQAEPVQPQRTSDYSPYATEYHYSYTNGQARPAQPEPPKKSGKTGKRLLALILAVIVIFCGVFGAHLIKNRNENESKTPAVSDADSATLQIEQSPTAKVDESDGLSAAEIYAKNQKSNVGILLYTSSQVSFFSNNSSGKSSVAGEGSGIVMGTSKDKSVTYIITCAHVISDAKSSNYKIVVQDEAGEQYDATFVGADSRTDIGVISIKGNKLPAATFGDSSKLTIGEVVYALGNPGGTEFFGSFTKGMISAIGRSVSSEIGYDMKCIQHDAAINPGNSGGMLLNAAGQVIGINSSKIASTEYEGMGFSIPITSAKPIIDDLIANGHVTDRAKLGIMYSPISVNDTYVMIAHFNKLPSGTLIIREISAKSAFSGTDVKVGDLIVAVNGEEMETADVLLEKIENGKVGDKLKLTIGRINESNYEVSKFDVTVTLVEDDGQSETTTTTQNIQDFWSPFFDNGQ